MRIGAQLMRCAGTAELCLLALLLLSLNAIGLSIRSRPFGIALGLGLMAAADCAQSLTAGTDLALSSAFQYGLETATYVSLGLWITYSVLPEPVMKRVSVRADSTIYRWDQIASALRQKTPQAALQPAQSFFLVDVEKVVDRAFLRTLQSKEVQS
jgi:Na+-driven multidrug efflux pump